MNRIVRFSAVTASVAAVVLVLSATSAGPALAQSPFKPLMALIINDAANPVPVVNVGTPAPAPEPFQHQVSSFVPASLLLPVPPGKRFVIEFYSGTASTRVPCTMAAMNIETKLSSAEMQHRLLAVSVRLDEPSEFSHYTFSQQLRLYAAPGTFVQFSASTEPGCPADFNGVVSGYLIDVP